ncbi:MAG: hypothetical protein HN348_22555, partial [Proteobacteria bacterium]|nr:hypothetical protein [Pseudomonadota bacterium]
MVTIKKYPNRRLYDTSRSKYINMEELTALVRANVDIHVVDAKSGEDLTREVLLQVVLEVLKGADFFPTGMLRRLIRATGDTPAQKMLRQQLSTGLQLMSSQLDRWEAMFGVSTPTPPPEPSTPPEPASAEEPSDSDDLAELRA